ncbi:YrhK family protein [Halobacillus salinarum]|uniref:YrhK family protein n=1 Tax=Halobacillus salinarum TaxID=2932257 RepID=A0ABY4EN39_9BACI|nr:YrhK family protein [Halobacillus salinarum]UOQ45074.1 YrhK family protein [Halobacillus salinarum]
MSLKNTEAADADFHSKEQYVDIKMGRHDIFFKKGYDVLYTINDFIIGIWFLIGSIFFYFESLQTWGVTLFVLGSVQLLIRPTIRLIHRFHMRSYYKNEYEQKRN